MDDGATCPRARVPTRARARGAHDKSSVGWPTGGGAAVARVGGQCFSCGRRRLALASRPELGHVRARIQYSRVFAEQPRRPLALSLSPLGRHPQSSSECPWLHLDLRACEVFVFAQIFLKNAHPDSRLPCFSAKGSS